MKMTKGKLLIVVHNGHYDMFGAPTITNRFRAAFIQRMGGINDTVEDGTYVFTITRKGLRLYTNLTPHR